MTPEELLRAIFEAQPEDDGDEEEYEARLNGISW